MLQKIRLHHFLMAGVCLAHTGCGASHQQTVRGKASDDPTAWSGSPLTDRSESSNDSDAGGGKGFLKASRLPGALSSEGSEIERSLGVGR